ncbi:MAG: hypothetical protein WAM85_17120 [Terracidiphilus sp.]
MQDQNVDRIGQLLLYLRDSALIDFDEHVVAFVSGFLKTLTRRPIVIAKDIYEFEELFFAIMRSKTF